MGEYNLLNLYPKTVRNLQTRKAGQSAHREIAKQFGFEYFDGTREEGYGGYHYDGRWVPIAHKIIERYNLKPHDKILDIGCAKGYLLKDLQEACPNLEVWGLDISSYAIKHSHEAISGRLIQGSVEKLPFKDNDFQAVICINVIHNLEEEPCLQAIREIQRISCGRSYIQVDAYRNELERQVFEDWVLTAKTHGTPDFWQEIFKKTHYTGDYYWTILEVDPLLII